MILQEAIPTQFTDQFRNFKSYRYRDEKVTKIHSNSPWPKESQQKNVFMWFTLSTGRIVGINKSPEGNISFPTKDLLNIKKPVKSTMQKPKKKKNKKSNYIRIGSITPEEFFAITAQKIKLFNHDVKMGSHRYQNFRKNGLECKHCGVKGEFFALEKNWCDANVKLAHFNLYGYDADGKEVMLTKDHIMPKAKGGKNHIDNYQVLCSKCNNKKGSNLPK